MTRSFFSACTAFLFAALIGPAAAHPHVWVTIRSEVLYTSDGKMTGIRHAWTFDDMFSTYAVQGIPQAKAGEFSRAELASLADVNVTSLKEFDYFTYARASGRKLGFGDPVDYWLDYANSALTLHFTLPLKTPIAAHAMQIEIYDPTIFVDFRFAKENAVSLVGAPTQCHLVVDLPHEPTPADQLRLGQLDDNPLGAGTLGESFANKILVKCP
jgi:ABC-type uncharacterized transport system substrate-binding protein